MNNRRVVVTGLGMVCAIGNSVSDAWNYAVNGITGIDDVKTFDTSACYSHKGGEVSLTDAELFDLDLDRSSLLCMKAANEAIDDSHLKIDDSNRSRIGVIMGTCVGGAVSIDKYYKKVAVSEEDATENPASSQTFQHDYYKMTASAIANNVASHVGASGITANIANACAAGTMSISYAADLIRDGKADMFLAGGSDAFSSLAYSGFHALHALSEEACSPLNHSDGITLGEGSAVLVLESYEHAVNRGAKIYCDVSGGGVSSDAHHITAPRPDGEGQMLAIKRAINSSGLTAQDIDYINAHGTGTKKNDEAEFLSLHTIFDGNNDLSVSSTKSMTGHCLGAAGSIEAVLSVKALCEDTVPPTIGYSNEDMEQLKELSGDIDFRANDSLNKKLDHVMSNSFAFGGNNASIIFSKEAVPLPAKKTDPDIFITGIGHILGSEYAEGRGYASNIGKELYDAHGIKMAFYRKLDHFSQLELISGVAAMENAGVAITDENASLTGIVIGTADGPIGAISSYQKLVNNSGIEKGSAFSFPNTVYNAAGGYLSIFSGIKGYNVTNANGVQAGLQSICYAADVLRNGDETVMLASGIDENSEFGRSFYDELGLIAEGSVLSEGAVTLVMEKSENLGERKPLAKLAGYGTAKQDQAFNDNLVPHQAILNAVKAALDLALDEKDLSDKIDLIIAPANARIQDICSELFTSEIPEIAITSHFGDARAASATLQAAVAAEILGGRNELTKDISELNTYKDAQNILVVSYGLGGNASAVILTKPVM